MICLLPAKAKEPTAASAGSHLSVTIIRMYIYIFKSAINYDIGVTNSITHIYIYYPGTRY